MDLMEKEKELVYSLYLPQLSSVPTLAEKQELVYRWFHEEDVEKIGWLDFKKFKALNLTVYDYHIAATDKRIDFNVIYLGLADGKVYHAITGESWLAPYYVSSYTTRGDQLYLRFTRDDIRVGATLILIAILSCFLALVVEIGFFLKSHPQ